jgi:hypothetical protein
MLYLSDSQPDSASPKNVLGPMRAALRAARHSVSLKNVPGHIWSSRHSLVLYRLPEKCSWTYLAAALHSHQTVSNLKNVPGPIRRPLRSLSTDDAYRENVPRPIGNSLRVPGRILSTRKMFLDLSRRCPPPSPNFAQPEKCSRTHPGIAPLVGHRR